MKRKTGYYWIKFPYEQYADYNHVAEYWEIGSYDAKVQTWLLVGSDQPWLSEQLKEIGPQLPAPKI